MPERAACYNTQHFDLSAEGRTKIMPMPRLRSCSPAAALAVLVMATPAIAQLPATGTELPLWSGPVPLATGTGVEDTPALTVYQPAPGTATGAAFVVLPGGGYRGRAAHEGEPVARWLASVGVTAFVARYRVSPYRHPAELSDA